MAACESKYNQEGLNVNGDDGHIFGTCNIIFLYFLPPMLHLTSRKACYDKIIAFKK